MTILDSEKTLVRYISEHMPGVDPALVRVGMGDDCAVLRPLEEGFEEVVTTDQVIENKHFDRELHPAGALGAKTLVRGVSDIAAMGAEPRWFTLSLCLGSWCSEGWVKQYLEGLFGGVKSLEIFGFSLIGGDLARGDFFSAHIAVSGSVEAGRALVRSGARAGDHVYVSGELGGSALGLERLMGGGALDDPAVRRHLWPRPRLGLGRFLVERGATAAMDLSDGLSIDAARLAEASGIAIEVASAPRFPGASQDQALHGGEEYELLFTVPPEAAIPSEHEGLAITKIGECREGGGVFRRDGDATSRLSAEGFDHFS